MGFRSKPTAGTVILYSFLWKHEHDAGILEGRKNRPCIVVLVSKKGKFLIAPITHSPPSDSTCIDLPQEIKRQLGLDDDKSWVISSELNKFTWPGFDIRAIPGRNPSTCAYGRVPPGYLLQVQSIIAGLARKRLVAEIDRDEEPS